MFDGHDITSSCIETVVDPGIASFPQELALDPLESYCCGRIMKPMLRDRQVRSYIPSLGMILSGSLTLEPLLLLDGGLWQILGDFAGRMEENAPPIGRRGVKADDLGSG